ncbi:MAG: helix-turn-helix domain-containing protein [Verrucomicrobiota bacterium]|jgi:excisionase family DNA binding protein
MSETTQPEPYLTIDEAAAYLKMSKGGLRKWMERRMLPFFRIGRCVRFRRSDLDAAMDARFRISVKKSVICQKPE